MSDNLKALYEDLSSNRDLAQIHTGLFRMLGYINRGFCSDDVLKGIIPESVSFAQFKTLMMIRFLGPCSIKRLSKTQGVSPASTSEMIDRLVELNLVNREQDPADRRRVLISLTELSVKGIKRHEKRIGKKMMELMTEIGPKYSRMWVEVSQELNRVLDKEYN